ncbi:MAG TPA: amino acid adenylation domain-containing protein, partial [Thermoanaerobaculia bacterium]|nr:amino acid adenylation domain-containing protein [Thermoanaerobaculia bacterium]
GDLPAEALRQALRERLPDYMVPATFVALDALPLTPNGKVDRKALPAPERGPSGEGYQAPRTPVEATLSGIWAELLGLPAVGIEDDFFALGGHSLLAAQVTSRIRRSFGAEIPLRRLFELRTIAALAPEISSETAAAPSLTPQHCEGDPPLSFAQLRLWFLAQLEPGSAAYNIPGFFSLRGTLDRPRLEAAFGEVVRRHEILRTSFIELDGVPVQRIAPPQPWSLPLVDLRRLPTDRREAEARRLAHQEAWRPFDLARPVLLRTLLLRLDAEEHAFLLAVHHIVSDGWSMGLLIREVAAVLAGAPLPELPVQYADYAVWQQRWLTGEPLDRELAFWQRQLRGVPPVLDLPTDHPRPAVQSFRGALVPCALPAGLLERLRGLAQREGATLFMVLLAALEALLFRLTGKEDFCVGSPVAGRSRLETEPLIGLFVNTLAHRAGLAGAPRFDELLARVHETALAAWSHQEIPFEKLVEALQPERNLSHAPLFQVMLAFQRAPWQSVDLPGLALRPLGLDSMTSKLDLNLILHESGEGVGGGLEFDTAFFDRTTALRLLTQLRTLLDGIAADSSCPVAELPLLPAAERHQVLAEWNDTVVDREEAALIHELFEVWAERTPGAVAAVCGGESMTYRELQERANRLAHHLAHLGIGPGSLVGIHLRRGLPMIPAVLAVLKAGAAYVPLEIGHPPARLQRLLGTLDISCVLTETAQLGVLPSLKDVVCLDRMDLEGYEPSAPPRRSTADDLAYVIFTSGSTGTPKGVMVRHRPVVNLLRWAHRTFEFSPADRALFVTSLAFDLSVFDIFGLLGAGGSIRIATEEEIRDPQRLLKALAEEPITFWDSAPAALEQTVPFLSGMDPQACPALRLVFLSGDWIPVTLPGRVRERFPSAQVISLGGATEATVWSNVFPIERVDPAWTSIPYGRPIENARYHVLDAQLAPIPVGVPGDLYIGGDCLADGYAREPELTAGKFLPDPWSTTPGARLYRTGDRARYRPDGNLEFLGRLDHQVKIRGFRIELGEIEAALLALPGVREAVVVVRPNTSNDLRLVAYVTGDAVVDTLRPALRERLPEPMVPSAFVALAALPLTPNGKVDRKALPDPEQQSAEEGYLAPRTPVEEVLAGLWADLLGRERVGVADHFFELGGHSLLATQVISRLREAFGVEIPLRELFEAPTPADLAVRLEAARRSGAAPPAPPLLPVPRAGDPPLSFAQERLWFLDQLEPGSPAYNIPGAVEITGDLDGAVLAAALRTVLDRHEVLRTVFPVVDGEPRQRILAALEVGLPLLDLAGLPPDLRRSEAERLAGEHALLRFDLTRGPLLDARLLRLDSGHHRLLVVLHHVICDGWSLPLLVRETGALYAAAQLPELPVQYADFAVWQRQVVAASGQSEIAWWQDRLSGEIVPLELPTDRARPPVQTFRGAQSTRVLLPNLTARLHAFGRAHGATLFMTLLAAIQALLHRHSGQDDVLVGAPVAGRRAVETEELIGCFLNTLVLRTDLGGRPGFRELVARVREVTLGAWSHQDVPFEAVLASLPQQRDLSRTPLFQVMVNLLNLPPTEMRLPGLTLAGSTTATPLSKLDMTFYVSERDGGVRVELVYNADLFDAARMEDLLAQLETLLDQALERPEAPIGGLSLVTAAARAVLPDPAAELSAAWEGAVHEVFARQARQTPGALAVTDPAESWTYAELAERAGQLAAFLRAHGVGQGDVVAFWAHRSAPLVWGVLGALEAGAAFLMLDPRYPAPRQAQMLEIARPSAWLQLSAAVPVPAEIDSALDAIGCACRLTLPARADGFLAPLLEDAPAAPPAAEVGPDNVAYVAFTSGSTGVPKGVLGRHGSLSHFIPWLRARFALTADDRFSLLSGLAHDPLHRDLFTPLQIGATVVIPDPETMDEPGRLATWMRREGVTVTHLTPALGQVLTTEAPDAPPVEVPSLRWAFLVGDVLTRRDVARLRRLAPGVTCVNYYGSTETQRAVGYHLAEEHGPREILPLGRGIPDVQLLVLNPAGALAGIGELGEISMRSPHIALGYLRGLGDPQLTAERFVADLYRTGDLGRYLPNGEAVFAGRADTQVKIRGFRIELGEIEAALGRFPGVREAVVIARQHQGTERYLAAYLVPAPGVTLTERELRAFLRDRLPDFMVPATFTLLDALPLTPNRKVDRRALPAPEWRPTEDAWQAPRTAVEEVLAGLWAEVLGRERIGATDDFFALGGHSLLATRVISRLRAAFGIE